VFISKTSVSELDFNVAYCSVKLKLKVVQIILKQRIVLRVRRWQL